MSDARLDALRDRIGRLRDRFGDVSKEDVFDALDDLVRRGKPSPTSGPVFLVDMATWLRNEGLTVIEYDGWQTRARGSGGYTAPRPFCVVWHHTASPKSWDGEQDASYLAEGDEDAPLSNLYIDRSGTVWVLAGGATNTNGKGRDLWFSKGLVPQDQMNTHAVGVEMGNDGVGEPWPEAQVNAAFIVSNTMNAWLGNRPDDVATHNHYAPDRKIDPATASAVQGPWKPRSSTSSGTWNVEDIANECLNRAGQQPIPPNPEPQPPKPPLPESEDDMRLYAFTDDVGTIWIGNGCHKRAMTGPDMFNGYVVLSATGGGPKLCTANGVEVREMGDVQYGTPLVIDALGVPV